MYQGSAGQVIAKVRAAAKKFVLSPMLNDELTAIAASRGCRLKLVLDVKTRWNSTVRMLEHFLELEASLREFYAARGRDEPFPLDDAEMAAVRSLVCALAVVDLTTKRLSLATATLRTSDLALQVRLFNCRAP